MQAVTEVSNFIRKRLQRKCFLSLIGFWYFFQNSFFIEHLWTVASIFSKGIVNSSSKSASNYCVTFLTESTYEENFRLTFLFLQSTRSSFIQMFFKISFLINFELFSGKYVLDSPFNIVALKTSNFIEKRLEHKWFLWNLWNF